MILCDSIIFEYENKNIMVEQDSIEKETNNEGKHLPL